MPKGMPRPEPTPATPNVTLRLVGLTMRPHAKWTLRPGDKLTVDLPVGAHHVVIQVVEIDCGEEPPP